MKGLTTFTIAVAICLLIVLAITWFYKDGERFRATCIFIAGYIIGWITLLIKIRLITQD